MTAAERQRVCRERRVLGRLPVRLCRAQDLAGAPDATPAELRNRGLALLVEALGEEMSVERAKLTREVGAVLLRVGSAELQSERALIGAHSSSSAVEDELYEMSQEDFESVVAAVRAKRSPSSHVA